MPAGASDTAGMCLTIGTTMPEDNVDSLWPELHLNLLAEEWSLRGRLPEGRWRLADTHWLEFAEADA
jgi:hypothetical protein